MDAPSLALRRAGVPLIFFGALKLKVKFTQSWRGYAAGDSAELNEARAKELIGLNYCEKAIAKKAKLASKIKKKLKG